MAELLEKIKEPSLFCFLSLSCDLLFAICFYSGPSSVYIYIYTLTQSHTAGFYDVACENVW